MMFELRHFHIMAKNTNLSGQPVICQLLSFIPTVLIKECLSEHQSDYYYKVMTTYRQLVFLLYGVISRCHSLRNLCKALLFLEEKLSCLGVDRLPDTSKPWVMQISTVPVMYLVGYITACIIITVLICRTAISRCLLKMKLTLRKLSYLIPQQ